MGGKITSVIFNHDGTQEIVEKNAEYIEPVKMHSIMDDISEYQLTQAETAVDTDYRISILELGL